jgi:hypothetical protein
LLVPHKDPAAIADALRMLLTHRDVMAGVTSLARRRPDRGAVRPARGDSYSVALDGPRNVLTVRAERRPSTDDDTVVIATERPRGVLSRQVILSDAPDTDRVQASHAAGRLTLRIPAAENTKPGKVAITNADPAADCAELTG